MCFFKYLIFVLFYENAAFRRDWCSIDHLFEGLGPDASDLGSPQWFPQAPLEATTNNSTYRGDWRSPGAPITSKWAFDFDGVHIFRNVCFCIFLCFRRAVVIGVRPVPTLDQYCLLGGRRRVLLLSFHLFLLSTHFPPSNSLPAAPKNSRGGWSQTPTVSDRLILSHDEQFSVPS